MYVCVLELVEWTAWEQEPKLDPCVSDYTSIIKLSTINEGCVHLHIFFLVTALFCNPLESFSHCLYGLGRHLLWSGFSFPILHLFHFSRTRTLFSSTLVSHYLLFVKSKVILPFLLQFSDSLPPWRSLLWLFPFNSVLLVCVMSDITFILFLIKLRHHCEVRDHVLPPQELFLGPDTDLSSITVSWINFLCLVGSFYCCHLTDKCTFCQCRKLLNCPTHGDIYRK